MRRSETSGDRSGRVPAQLGRLDWLRVLGVAAVCAASVLVAWPAPAEASITGGCSGSLVIDGITYGPDNDTPGDPIVVPNRSDVVADWFGSVPFANTNARGEASLVIGPGSVGFAEWSGANAEDVREGSGSYALDDLKAALPVDVGVTGIYEVKGFHEADGGRCTGRVFVRFEGNLLGTPLGLVSAIGLVISIAGLVGAAVAKAR